jgi:hypothetical protein
LQKLGYLEYDIEQSMKENSGVVDRVFVDLLKHWRDQDPIQATKFRLKRYLEECGMIDAAIIFD